MQRQAYIQLLYQEMKTRRLMCQLGASAHLIEQSTKRGEFLLRCIKATDNGSRGVMVSPQGAIVTAKPAPVAETQENIVYLLPRSSRKLTPVSVDGVWATFNISTTAQPMIARYRVAELQVA